MSFDFVICFNKIVLRTTKFGGHKINFGGHCSRMYPVATGLIQRKAIAFDINGVKTFISA